jgi:hypothetical protein
MTPIKPYFLHHVRVASKAPVNAELMRSLELQASNTKGKSRLHPQIRLITIEDTTVPELSKVNVFFKKHDADMLTHYPFESKKSQNWTDFAKNLVIDTRKMLARQNNGISPVKTSPRDYSASSRTDPSMSFYHKLLSELSQRNDVKLFMSRHQLEKTFKS